VHINISILVMYCVGVLAFAREPEPKFSPKNEKDLGMACTVIYSIKKVKKHSAMASVYTGSGIRCSK